MAKNPPHAVKKMNLQVDMGDSELLQGYLEVLSALGLAQTLSEFFTNALVTISICAYLQVWAII